MVLSKRVRILNLTFMVKFQSFFNWMVLSKQVGTGRRMPGDLVSILLQLDGTQ